MAKATTSPSTSDNKLSNLDQVSSTIMFEMLASDYPHATGASPTTNTFQVVDAVLNGMQRLYLANNTPPGVTPLQNLTNLCYRQPLQNPDVLTTPTLNVASSDLKTIAKRKKSVHTKKAHKVFSSVETHTRSCLERLADISLPTDIATLEADYYAL